MAQPRKTAARRARPARVDAISLLKQDHRDVEDLFTQFRKARAGARKAALAERICSALAVHAQIEEEIFYPAFASSNEDPALHHEAIIEHEGVKNLIRAIEAKGPDDEYFDARVKVLCEMVSHHVKEEERPGGMFSEARAAKLDLVELGAQLATRKSELTGKRVPGARRSAPLRPDQITWMMPV